MLITFADIKWPTERRYRILNARVPACLVADSAALTAPLDAEGVARVDVLIEDGKLAGVDAVPARGADGVTGVDVAGRQVWPTLIDIHTHLDKGHTVTRSPNPDGTFHNARLAAVADRRNWTAADLRRRMDFGLRCAHAHGVSAIRTHIDTYPDCAERSWSVVCQIHEKWQGRIYLQPVSLCPSDLLAD